MKMLKIALLALIVLIVRLAKGFLLPGIEPVMATVLPLAKQSKIQATLFTVATMVVFDVMSDTLSIMTIVTAGCYGLVAAAAGKWFCSQPFTTDNAVGFSFIATIVYDFVTGVVAIPILTGASYHKVFMDQIPVTIEHVIGNTFMAAMLSPLIHSFINWNPRFGRRGVAHA